MLDRLTDSFFWPALIGAWMGGLVGLAAVMAPHPLLVVLRPVTAILAVFALLMFVVMLFDRPTRRAVEAYNAGATARWREMTWKERLFSPEQGDRSLLIVNRLAWLEGVVFVVMGRQDLALLCLVSFSLSTMMLMLMLKRRRA